MPKHAADTASGTNGAPRARLHGLDAFRGVLVVLMVTYHVCYDLVFMKGVSLPWFQVHGPLLTWWRWLVAWSFLFVAGSMCAVSRSNLRRAGKYLLVAAVIFVVTSLAGFDAPISFGIVFCMGASTLIAWALDKAGILPRGPVAMAVLLVVFALVVEVPFGRLGIPWVAQVPAPRAPYELGWLSWLGFPGPGFVSSDYYPLIPNTLMFLAGAAMGPVWKEQGWPAWCSELRCPPLEWLGRHALEVYILHQPLALAVLTLLLP